MKNLKRVLSLALSGIMLVGMMAMSASAVNAEDFTDADEITHTEAVSISTALKIIDGKEDGSFDPNGFVTRGQMAKMITRAMFGGEDPVLGLPSTPTFSDIKGRWDESYIEYCANNTIINGRGDGTFDPEGNVTGTEAAKMLLTALGYKADIYGLVGPDWAITTNSIANQTSVALYAGLKGLDPTQPFTRDQVAQMVYNALNAETREMNPNMTITNGEVTYGYTASGRTLLYDKYGAVRVEGIVESNSFSDNSEVMKGKTTIRFTNSDEIEDMLRLSDSSLTNYAPKMAVESGKDAFGRAVIVYVKPYASNNKDFSKATVISDIILDEAMNTVVSTTAGFGTNKDMDDFADDKGLKFTTNNGATTAKFFNNYAEDTNNSTAFGTLSSGLPTYVNTLGEEVILIDNDADGEVEYALHNTYAFGQISKLSTKDDGSITVRTNGGGTLAPNNAETAEVVFGYEDAAVNDYVNVTLVDKTYYVEKAEVVNGDLEDYENNPEPDSDETQTVNLTVDDTTYKVSKAANAYAGTEDLKAITAVTKANVLTNEITVYLDAFGYAVAGKTNAVSEWLFVANAAYNNAASGLSSGTLTAFVYFEDGTSGSYAVDRYTVAGNDPSVKGVGGYVNNFTSSSNATAIKGKLFQYSMTSSDKLVLVGADSATLVAGKQSEQTVATASGVEYNKELSKLTIGTANKTDGKVTSVTAVTDTRYVTMDTPVFFVSLDAQGAIDSVRVYSQKTASSMMYETEAGATLWNPSATPNAKFNRGITYVTTADSRYDLDAVVFTNTEALGSDWLYLIKYVKTNDFGRIYWAYVDGEIEQIQTNDKTPWTVKNAYSYSMDGDMYDISNLYNVKLVDSGKVTLTDSKSVIIDLGPTGTEFSVNNGTVKVFLDGADSYTDADLHLGDQVTVIHDNEDKAEAIFITATYDDMAHKVLYTKTGATVVTDNDTTHTATVNLGAAHITGGAAGAADDLKKLFVGTNNDTRNMVLLASAPAANATISTIKNTTEAADSAVTNGATLYLVVIADGAANSSDEDYTVYTVSVLGTRSITFEAQASAGSSNINVLFFDNDSQNWLNEAEIKALGITPDKISVKVGGSDKPLEAGTDSNYPWNGSSICVIPDDNTSAQTYLTAIRTMLGDDDVSFMKLHTGSAFTATESVAVTITGIDGCTFTSTGNWTVR